MRPSTMVVGNGLLARAFQRYEKDDHVIVFASGVSNSQQKDAAEFSREKKLLSSFHKEKATLIYFSTVSVHDPSMQLSPYITHKKSMEQLIIESFSSYLIFRLPILVGKTDNPFTLTNFFFRKIMGNEPLQVYKNACRYLMDTDDVSHLIAKMIDSQQFENKTLDINFDNGVSIEQLIGIFEKVLVKKATLEILNAGSFYSTNNTEFRKFIDLIGFQLPVDYTERTIQKYYGGNC